MLRVTVLSQSREEVVLKVEGWVSGKSVELLEQEGERWLRKCRRLVLELSGVRFIDSSGIALLERWPPQQVSLLGGSPFVRSLLRRHGLS